MQLYFGLKVVASTLLLIALVPSASSKLVADKSALPCSAMVKCSSVEDLVWATDGERCLVFRNACHLYSENCQRRNQNEEVLKDLPKEECQKLCKAFCTREFSPICGYYNELKRTFSNRCMMESHVCRTGESYSLFSVGQCEDSTSSS